MTHFQFLIHKLS